MRDENKKSNENTKLIRSYTNSYHKGRMSLKQKSLFTGNKEKESLKVFNPIKNPMRSDNKLVNFSEMIPKLLDQIKTINPHTHNIYLDNSNSSFDNESNSSEVNDDNESKSDINNISNKPNNNKLIKIPKLLIDKTEDIDEDKKIQAPATYRQKRKIDYSVNIKNMKYSKENKEDLIPRLHKYFFQDGELENIDTLIKYNINKIKINENINNEENSEQNLGKNSQKDLNESFDFFGIRQQVIKIMDKFADAFDKENKHLLVSAIKNLGEFSIKYNFDYVTELTLDWIKKLKDKIYDNCEIKYIGYYNQIRDIMDEMLKELKKKADLIIISQKNNKDNIAENENINNINKSDENIIQRPTVTINQKLLKKNSINKEDLLRTKEIIPIKIDIEVQKSLNINEVEEILKNLNEGDSGYLGNKENNSNNKKLLNKNINNRNQNELEAFSYPFKEDRLCYIF